MTLLDYKDYEAKAPGAGAPTFDARRMFYDTVLLPYALARHRRLLRRHRRVSDHTYTCFLRSPSQLQLLTGPILDYLGRPDPLTITLLACSNGAEAYTLASWLRQVVPWLNFEIRASDLHDAMVTRAATGRYSRAEVLHSAYLTEDFLKSTFLPDGDDFIVRPEVRAQVSFSQADLLDGDGLRARFGQAPLVVAQNVLFHLSPDDAERAFDNLVSLAAPRSVLMVEGMDLDVRERVTARHGLEPFTENERRIYEETRIHTPPHWWRVYWGTEPYLRFRPNRKRRYATAFKRDAR